MILYIDTTENEYIYLALLEKDKAKYKIISSKKIKAFRQQSEKLIAGIDKLLKLKKVDISSLSQIVVNNEGISFTALRIGVITANALAFSLSIPVYSGKIIVDGNNNFGNFSKLKKGKIFSKFSLVKPIYSAEPNIGIKKAC